MANGYQENLSIDRIDPNGNYEPSNCRWADANVQANNKRNNHRINYTAETLTLAQWAEKRNIPYQTLWLRLYRYGWSVEEALTIPIGGKRKKK